jgi:lipoic acid synthetase
MILGDVCTRGCRFCSVSTGKPHFPASDFGEEAVQLAEAAARLKLSHIVITSVARDDLEDGGASGFSASIAAVRERLPDATIEVLVPDFGGRPESIRDVVEAGPDILNHNLETVPRLYRRVRPGAGYRRSLELLLHAKDLDPKLRTKTGIMLGLGEKEEEVREVFSDAARYKVDIFTAGQYMQPTRSHLAVDEYLTPERFEEYRSLAETYSFQRVFIGPLVRSSYHADEFFS